MENKKKLIIVFLPRCNWDSGNYRRPESIAHFFTQNDDVSLFLYINHLHDIFSIPKYKYLSQLKRLLWFYPCKIRENFFVFTPFLLIPKVLKFKYFEKINNYFLKIQFYLINKWLNKYKGIKIGFINPYRNNVLEYINKIKYKYLVADVYDDPFDKPLAAAIFKSKKVRLIQEKKYIEVLKECDVVFSNTQHIIDKYSSFTKNGIFLVTSGVDFDLISESKNLIPKDLKRIERPRIGYIGVINHSVDAGLLNYIVKKNSEKNFILVGKLKDYTRNVRKIIHMEKKYQNLFLLNSKPHEIIPYYINNMDVLFAFKKPCYARGGDSLKIYEYLATGKPIITTSISPAKRFESLLYFTDNKYKFNNYLNNVLNEKNLSMEKRRMEEVKKYSWKNKANFMIEKIQNFLENTK